MRFASFLVTISVFATLFSTIESRKTKITPITFYTTKELDSNHLIRTILVFSGVAFSEIRFKKDSESQKELFKEISKSGFLLPSIPMISDDAKSVKYISTNEAVTNYLVLSYNKELFSTNLLLHSISIQLSSIVKRYIDKAVKILNASKTLDCSRLLNFESIHVSLNVLNNTFDSTKSKFFTGNKVSYADVSIYTLILFIENVSPGCVIFNYNNLKNLALNISSVPQIFRFENSSYFLSLLVPGTHTFAKRINFALGTSKFSSLAS